MPVNAPPARNPAQDDSLAGVLEITRQRWLRDLDDMLPAVVIAAERGPPPRAQVQPLIMMVDTLDNRVSRAQVASVPVLQLGGGGFVLSFPIQPGDLGWIKANDRDISLFKQSGSEAHPNTKRLHSFEDALFIPDAMLNYVIAEEDEENAVLQSVDGSVRLAFWPDKLKITAPRMSIGDIEEYTPDPNAILDLQSTTKAFMYPRMTEAQRDAIPDPSEGMAVWNLDTHGVSVYNGTSWS